MKPNILAWEGFDIQRTRALSESCARGICSFHYLRALLRLHCRKPVDLLCTILWDDYIRGKGVVIPIVTTNQLDILYRHVWDK